MKKFNPTNSRKNSIVNKYHEKSSLNDTEIETCEKEISVNKFQDKDEVLKHVQNIENFLNEANYEQNEDRMREEQELKFKFAAIVLDRFFFFVAAIYAIVTFGCLVLLIPNFYKF